jgi:soluble cytochrome b562
MDSINDHLRELRGQIGDAARKAENLALVQTVKENLEAAQKLVPEKAAELSGPDREAFLKAFHAKIEQVLGTVDELARAIDSGLTDQARELLVKLNDLKKEGHSQFKKPE